MKTRIISAIIMIAILLPIFIMGGTIYDIAIWLIGLLGLKEFLDIKATKKQVPVFIKIISYILFTLLVLISMVENNYVISMDFRLITGLFISLLLPVTLYHDRETYSINDAFYLIGSIFFLGVSFNLLTVLRDWGLEYIIYLFIITIMTDTYAYFGGMLIGRNKLLESVSPKKTIEGMIIGTIFGTIFGVTYYHIVVDPTLTLSILVLITLFLSILGQFGDLVFSSIKRYFGKKDFSNLIPGHGGVLDRFDSIIFVVLGFMFFITII